MIISLVLCDEFMVVLDVKMNAQELNCIKSCSSLKKIPS